MRNLFVLFALAGLLFSGDALADQRPDSRIITHRRSVDWGPTENEDEYWVVIAGYRKDQYPLSDFELAEVSSSPFAGYKSKSVTYRLSSDKCEVHYDLRLLSDFDGDELKRAIDKWNR